MRRRRTAERGPAGVGRSTAIFALWTAVSRVSGLAREILAAALFGTQGAINAFVVAFNIPNVLRSIVADSALSAAFLPVFTELEESGRRKEARRLAGALVGLITITLGALTLVAVVAAPWYVPFLAPGLSDDLVDQTVLLAQVMFPIVVLLGLTGLVTAILQAAGEFGMSAFAPVLWNLAVIAGLAVATPLVSGGDRIVVYAAAVVAGSVIQLAYLVPGLRGKGPFPLAIGLRNRHVRRVIVLMLPVTVGLGLINVNFTVDTVFATLVSDEAPRAIDAAFRIYVLPQGVFSVAIATVLFPLISRQVARGDTEAIRATLGDGLRQIAFFLLPASAFLLVLSEPVVRLIFERGEFGPASTAQTAEALVFFSLGLTFNGASLLLVRVFFSLRLPWLPTAVAAAGVVVNAALNAAFVAPLGLGGIPLSTSVSSALTAAALFLLLERRLSGLGRRDVVRGLASSLAVAVAAGGAALATWRGAEAVLGEGTLGLALGLAAAVVAAAAAALALARLLRMPELAQVTALRRPAG